jgi:F-type H+-transporting ATPase subunit epsilon
MVLQVQLVSPERILFEGEADMLVCRTLEGGDVAFLPGHQPFLGALGVGAVRFEMSDHTWQSAAVHGGFVEVANDRVIVLSDVAEMAADIDVKRAEAARQRAEAVLAKGHDADASAALTRANTRIAVATGAASAAH